MGRGKHTANWGGFFELEFGGQGLAGQKASCPVNFLIHFEHSLITLHNFHAIQLTMYFVLLGILHKGKYSYDTSVSTEEGFKYTSTPSKKLGFAENIFTVFKI